MIGQVINNDEDTYFTIAYILLTIAVIGQVMYLSFVVYSYQTLKRKILEKGRLLQILPLISVASVYIQPNQLVSYAQPSSSSAQMRVISYPGFTNKVPPPPYVA